jgi:hypothetical protein
LISAVSNAIVGRDEIFARQRTIPRAILAQLIMRADGVESCGKTGMIYLVRILGTLIALGVATLSVAMTFSFGLAFANGADSYIYAGLFAALDGAKFLLPTLAGFLAYQGMKKQARIARICYFFFAFLSAASHVGLTLKASGDARSSQAGVEEAQAAYRTKKAELDNLGVVRSSGQIEADIAIAERDPIFTDEKRSSRCVNDTVPASLAFCQGYRKLTGERQDRKDYDRISGELVGAKAKLDAARSAGGAKANELANAVSELLSVEEETAMLIMAVLMAIGIEMGSSLLLELAVAAGHKPLFQEAPPVTPAESVPSMIPARLIAQDGAETRKNDAENVQEKPTPAQPVLCPRDWVASRMQPNKRTTTPYDTALATYKGEAEAAGMAPASDNAFSRALTAHGYERKRPGGVTRILATEIRRDVVRPALVAVK